MISHELKCIFIHIPKTAGTSIECQLGHFEELTRGVQDHRTLRQIQPIALLDLVLQNPAYKTHYSYPDVVKSCYRQKIKHAALLSFSQYEVYYKFAFVRNSWSRAVSWYKNVMRDPIHQKSLNIPATCSFKDFLLKHTDQWALKSQLFWLLDSRGNLPYDFIGRFENLEAGFAKVCTDLKIPCKDLPKLLIDSQKSPYPNFYDEETKSYIAKTYRDEINLFGFKFGE
ncbi:MAG: sulfotransferase family 2 domain-containing protein [Nodosilinea sp.]